MTTKINLIREKNNHLIAFNEKGVKTHIDHPKQGETPQGMDPGEILLSALASCSSYSILRMAEMNSKKLEKYEVSVEGFHDETPAGAFTKITLHYTLWTDMEEKMVEKAMNLAFTKYCTVAFSLDKKIVIEKSFTIKPV